jgi:hypothetical protein
MPTRNKGVNPQQRGQPATKGSGLFVLKRPDPFVGVPALRATAIPNPGYDPAVPIRQDDDARSRVIVPWADRRITRRNRSRNRNR